MGTIANYKLFFACWQVPPLLCEDPMPIRKNKSLMQQIRELEQTIAWPFYLEIQVNGKGQRKIRRVRL